MCPFFESFFTHGLLASLNMFLHPTPIIGSFMGFLSMSHSFHSSLCFFYSWLPSTCPSILPLLFLHPWRPSTSPSLHSSPLLLHSASSLIDITPHSDLMFLSFVAFSSNSHFLRRFPHGAQLLECTSHHQAAGLLHGHQDRRAAISHPRWTRLPGHG